MNTGLFGVMLFGSIESILVLALIVCVGFKGCAVIADLGKEYLRSPGTVKVKVLGVEINTRAAGVLFIFLAIVITLTVMYVILRIARSPEDIIFDTACTRP
jgi:hypothetical protein